MKINYRQSCVWIEQQSLSMRLLLLTLTAIVIFLIWRGFMQWAYIRDTQLLSREVAELETNIDRLEKRAKLIVANAHAQSQPHLRQQHQRMNAKKEDLDQQLQHYQTSLTQQTPMGKGLNALLQRIPDVEMLQLESQVQALLPKPPHDLPYQLLRQNYTLILQGDYFAILNFFQQAKSLDGRIFWDAMDYQVLNYPQAKVTIKLHTLKAKEHS